MLKRILLTTTLVVTAAGPVWAQTTATTPTPTPTAGTTVSSSTPTPLATSDRAQAHAAFAAKIKQRLDARKQQLALRAVDRLKTINTNRTSVFTLRLTFLTGILAKITVRTDALEKQGVNVTAVRTAITTATNAITIAQTAVNTQAAKEYTVTIPDTGPVGAAFVTVIQQLQTDLQSLRQNSLEPARQAVIAAFQAFRAAEPKTSPSPLTSASPSL